MLAREMSAGQTMSDIVSHCGAGMARFTCHDPHNVYDVIPCDLVASGILVAACALTKVSVLAILTSSGIMVLQCNVRACSIVSTAKALRCMERAHHDPDSMRTTAAA